VNPAATRTIGYLRCSTEPQTDSGFGLEAQEAALRSAAVLRLTLVCIRVDAGASGKLGIGIGRSCSTRIGALRC
jgi:DNA invertase Pin-like site-specific DNA recombinase